jgi:hypothetical protein
MTEDYFDSEEIHTMGNPWPEMIIVNRYARTEEVCSCCHKWHSEIDPVPFETKIYVPQEEK